MTITSFDLLTKYIWFDGELMPCQDARLSPLTHSLHYSGAVYEGERLYEGKIFKLKEHTERLIASANILHMQVPYSIDEIMRAHDLLMNANQLRNAYVRPLIWRGSETLNMTSSKLSTHIMIAAIAVRERSRNPLKLWVSRWRKPHPNCWPHQAKSSGNYTLSIISQTEAKNMNCDDALLLDWQEYIAECATSNIFFVTKNKLTTPLAHSALNGITRQTVISLAYELKLEVKEQNITLDQLSTCDECFVTGTAIEVQPVQSIDTGIQKFLFDKHDISSQIRRKYISLVQS